MENILSPIAISEICDYNDPFNFNEVSQVICDDANGNVLYAGLYECSSRYTIQSLQSSLENLVNNFDSIISECFNCEERIDSWSPISERYKSCNSLVDKNQLWLSLTSSVSNNLNLDWCSFKSFEKFKYAINFSKEDLANQNLDLPDDEELTSAMDHHSLVTSFIPSDLEPLKTADEVIEEIDKIMGSSNDELNNGDMTSTLDSSFIIDSNDIIQLRRNILLRPVGSIDGLQKMSQKQLNDVIDELDDSIRDYSCILVEELAERDDLEYEKEQRDLFVRLIHEIEGRRLRQEENSRAKTQSDMSLDDYSFEDLKPKRSLSWKSVLSHSQWDNDIDIECETNGTIDRISKSSDNLNRNSDVSIPIHRGILVDRDILETLNQMLHAMIMNPLHFNQLLTDYILNVYAPADESSLCMSLDIL